MMIAEERLKDAAEAVAIEWLEKIDFETVSETLNGGKLSDEIFTEDDLVEICRLVKDGSPFVGRVHDELSFMYLRPDGKWVTNGNWWTENFGDVRRAEELFRANHPGVKTMVCIRLVGEPVQFGEIRGD